MRDRSCDWIIQAMKWISQAVKVFPVWYNSQQPPSFELINADGFASLDFATRLLLLVLKSLQLSVSYLWSSDPGGGVCPVISRPRWQESSQVSLQRVCLSVTEVLLSWQHHPDRARGHGSLGGWLVSETVVSYFCICTVCKHTRFHVGLMSWLCVCVCFFFLPDSASAGAGRGSRCDIRQGIELWHYFTGERENHRAGVQEPALLPAAEGRQRHTRWGFKKQHFIMLKEQ